VGLIVGVAHNLIAVWLYEEKGRGATILFLVASILVGLLGVFAWAGRGGGGI
jgi:hypothetical protein